MKIGIEELDSIVEIPERSTLLLLGPAIPIKTIFYLKFLFAGLKNDIPGILITTDKTPFVIREVSTKEKIWIENYAKNLIIVDCASWSLKERKKEENVIFVPGPAALNEISVSIEQAKEKLFKLGKNMRMVFDSLSTLLLYNNPNTIYRFLQVITTRAKASYTTSLFSLEHGMHDPKIVSTIEHLTDGTIRFREEEGKYYIKVSRIKETDWIELK